MARWGHHPFAPPGATVPDPTPADLLATLLADDPARPRVTCYDDLPGPTAGERIELSARVLEKWVAKAGNALQEEWDIAPGSRVGLHVLPHWRALCWALATWTVGATLSLDPEDDLDVLVTDTLPARDAEVVVYLTRASLARSADATLPVGVIDEAAELASFGDHLDPWDAAAPSDAALVAEGATLTYGDLVTAARRRWPDVPHGARVDVAPTTTLDLLLAVVAAWSGAGSVVLHVGGATDPDVRSRRAHDEGVDRSL